MFSQQSRVLWRLCGPHRLLALFSNGSGGVISLLPFYRVLVEVLLHIAQQPVHVRNTAEGALRRHGGSVRQLTLRLLRARPSGLGLLGRADALVRRGDSSLDFRSRRLKLERLYLIHVGLHVHGENLGHFLLVNTHMIIVHCVHFRLGCALQVSLTRLRGLLPLSGGTVAFWLTKLCYAFGRIFEQLQRGERGRLSSLNGTAKVRALSTTVSSSRF